jgi:hypothetical protein
MALLYSMFQVHQGLGGLDGHLEQDRFTWHGDTNAGFDLKGKSALVYYM